MTTQISVESISLTTHQNIPVITTELLAQLYGTEVIRIQQNHARNAERFIEGKHFFKLVGLELRELKHRLSLSES
ncbi:ORF6N domain-containing protein, partial [Salmonella enterica]|nr:ORF6N domain-containing protein [Salmonella enterica]